MLRARTPKSVDVKGAICSFQFMLLLHCVHVEIKQARTAKTALVGGAPQQQKVVATSAPAFVPKAQVAPGEC